VVIEQPVLAGDLQVISGGHGPGRGVGLRLSPVMSRWQGRLQVGNPDPKRSGRFLLLLLHQAGVRYHLRLGAFFHQFAGDREGFGAGV